MKLNSTQEIIADIKAGKMVILMDDEDRENEGDLIIAAEHICKQSINFMAMYGRGLICLTLTEKRCKQLNLPLMVNHSKDIHTTNFTLSIEAAKGVTTGISAADRTLTIQAAVAKDAVPADIVMPGHVFPLMAQPGGVLTRAGHTEAGCDLARLAGCEPASVIVEILNQDGSMARRPDLEVFSKEHNIKIGTVANLIEYRVKNEKTIERVTNTKIRTKYGKFKLIAFRETISNEIHLALIKGKVKPNEAILVRVHMFDPLCDLFSVKDDICSGTLEVDLKRIALEDNAVLIVLRKDKDSELLNRIMLYGKPEPTETSTSSTSRMYGTGAQILSDLGVRKMIVLGTPKKFQALSGFGLEVIEQISHKS